MLLSTVSRYAYYKMLNIVFNNFLKFPMNFFKSSLIVKLQLHQFWYSARWIFVKIDREKEKKWKEVAKLEEDEDKMKAMRREEMKEEKEKKAQESIYLRIEKCVLAYSVTSGAS